MDFAQKSIFFVKKECLLSKMSKGFYVFSVGITYWFV